MYRAGSYYESMLYMNYYTFATAF